MLLLGLDLETGGKFDAPKSENFITEIGACLWDTEIGGPVKIFSEVIDLGKDICEEAEEYTGLTNDMRLKWGIKPAQVSLFSRKVLELKDMFNNADYIVAHNGNEFDKPLTLPFIENYSYDNLDEAFKHKHWLDSRTDVPYPRNCKSRSLTYLGAFHKIINFFPHRAITDVLVMMDIVQRYDLNRIIEISHSPTLELIAMFEYPDKRKFKNPSDYARSMEAFNKTKDQVRSAGFHWIPDDKKWTMPVKEIFLDEVTSNLKFPFKVVKNETQKEG